MGRMKKARRLVAGLASGIGLWGAIMSSPGVAIADTTVDLPNDSLTQTLPDGTSVTVSVRDQYAIISPAMVAVQTSRNMWANGTIRVDVEGKSDEGRITPGYIVGCQIHFGAQAGGTFNGGVGGTGTGLNSALVGGVIGGVTGAIAGGAPGAALAPVGVALGGLAGSYLPEGGIGFSLEPGQAIDVAMLSIEEPDDYGNQGFDNYFAFAGNHGGITYTDVTFSVDGCAGYAQARPYARVRVKNSRTMAWVTLWGPPFSIG